MAFILFSDSLFNTTYNLLHTTDILHEKISDLSLVSVVITISLLYQLYVDGCGLSLVDGTYQLL